MFNPFKQLFKSKAVVEAEEERDLTVIEEEIQSAADSVDALIERRAERATRIDENTKLKAHWDRLNSQRRGRGAIR